MSWENSAQLRKEITEDFLMKKQIFKTNHIESEVYVDEENKTIWMNAKEIGKLYNKGVDTIRRNIKKMDENIDEKNAKNGEINAKMLFSSATKTQTFYSQEIILKLGQRFGSDIVNELEEWIESLFETKYELKVSDNKIVRYNQDNIDVDVMFDINNNTVWLTQDQMAVLFGTTKSNISTHISNIYQEDELEERATVQFFLTVQNEGGREVNRNISYYNLDVVISVGYRVKSKQGTLFRKWSTARLRDLFLDDYLKKKNELIQLDESEQIFLRLQANQLLLNNKAIELENKLSALEKKIILDPFLHELIENKSQIKAITLLSSIISGAKEEIILIDPYIDINTLDV